MTTVDDLGAGSYEVFLSEKSDVATRFEILDAGRENKRRPINEVGLRKLAEETGGVYLKIDKLQDLRNRLPDRRLIEVGGEPPWILWGALGVCLVVRCDLRCLDHLGVVRAQKSFDALML